VLAGSACNHSAMACCGKAGSNANSHALNDVIAAALAAATSGSTGDPAAAQRGTVREQWEIDRDCGLSTDIYVRRRLLTDDDSLILTLNTA
jgi:hypothetical protein